MRGSRREPTPAETDEPQLASFTALLEDSAEDLYEHAPCGYLSTLMDGEIAKVNGTLLGWLGYTRDQVVGRMRFSDLLTVGGRLYHETHFAPLLRMQGKLDGVALELRTADGERLPVLVTSLVKTDSEGRPLLIRTTLFDARDRRAYERELLRARKEAEEARRKAEREREHLQEVLAILQSSLLPPSLPAIPGLEARAYYRTASPDDLGGDFYDLFPAGDDRWGFFLGDVCGKGPEAAAVTSLTRYTLRAAVLGDPDPVAALTTLNTALLERYEGAEPRFCTVVTGMFTRTGEASYSVDLASGGHPYPMLLGADGRAGYLDTQGGPLVGVLPDPGFTATTTTLEPGDTFLLYTDGLTEAPMGRGVRYGEERLLEFAERLAPATPGEVIDSVAGLLDGFGERLDDDTALLAVGVPGGTARRLTAIPDKFRESGPFPGKAPI
ncbi:SpoIIE family protein phosphatase [Actinoallomurus spadix]|uniref:SpoIIE family protein phosphatase n=1 Tax=Actinoallomurus spadix TaxID=79912 RepID=A0ABN0W0H3_9ACTN|nr:SpoIIE family protein phosphatase [Actinoallomurus spadix]MCO5988216.1 SpoIIE family protein phosphatase [Actinoallomurus spadix]